MVSAGDWLRWQGNALEYRLRSSLTFSLPYEERFESKDGLFQERENAELLKARERELLLRYDLERIRVESSRQRYLEVLTYLEQLDFLAAQTGGFLPEQPEGTLHWLDVGAKNWSYVPALYHFLQGAQADFRLDGIEVDPYRRYTDFRSRADYARFYTRHYPRAHYHAADALAWSGDFNRSGSAFYQVISNFLPFVLPEPCLAWGLPKRFFQPRRQLEHLASLLLPGGVMLITNQGEWEQQAQERLLRETAQNLRLVVEWNGEIPTSFLTFRFSRFGWLLRKVST